MSAIAIQTGPVPLVGNPAPAWKATGYLNGEFRQYSSEEQLGRWYMLFFYPLDFTPV